MMLSFTKNETLLLDAYHEAAIFEVSNIYTWKKLGNTSRVTRVNFELIFSYILRMF